MIANKHTPESRYPLPVLPSGAFIPLREAGMGMMDTVRLRTTELQMRKLGILALVDGASIMDEIRGAVEPFLQMYYDPSNYYEFPMVEELPNDDKKLRFSGRLGMSQLWRLSKITQFGTPDTAKRFNATLYSANDFYIQRRLEDDTTFGAFTRQEQKIRLLMPPPLHTRKNERS